MLKKIKVIQDKIIQIKNEKKYDEKTMSFLMKAAKLLSDFPTLWNVRKILENKYNLDLYTTKGELFSQQLEIYNMLLDNDL